MIILVAAFSLIALQSNAQYWTANGGDIFKNNAGNVGIGINTPTSLLQVNNTEGQSDLSVTRPYNVASGNSTIGTMRIINPTTGDLLNLSLRYKNGTHEMIQSAYSSATSSWLAFSYLNMSTGKYEMRNGITDAEYKNTGNVIFSNTGGVMIDTTYLPAGYSLAVNGKVMVESLEVQLGGSWPDYVFSDNYQLRSLHDLEIFINANNHLPEVPSAQEVENGTLNVGDMNATLLLKVEELTLYVIQLQKEVDLLKESK